MKRFFASFFTLALLALSLNGFIVGVSAQDGTPTIDPAMVQASPITEQNCEGVVEYARVLLILGTGMAAESYGLPTDSVSEWTDEAYMSLIAVLSDAIAQLTGVTPPEAAQKLNEYAIVALKALQGAIVFIRTSGIGQNLPFANQIDQADDVLTEIINTLQQACPSVSDSLESSIATPDAG